MRELLAGSYEEAVAFLESVPRFTKKNPLEETKGFYGYIQRCGSGAYDERKLGKLVHVAGTNGKGSVCAFVNRICMESGYRTAMFTSPHLVTTRERFCIDGGMITEEEFCGAFNWLAKKIGEYHLVQPGYRPTYFERLFFMGIYVFARAGVDVTILETGLGGRLDATNVIRQPAVTVITEIGLDHTEYLGGTVGEIAGEKAGIIKRGIPVVFSGRKKEASAVICQKAEECGSKWHAVSENDYKIIEIKKKYIDFSVASRYYDYGSLTACTVAAYQAENAAVAIRACELLKNDCGFGKITVKSIKAGIRTMHWAGRMEEIQPGVYIDGAHNEDGIEAFAQTVDLMGQKGGRHILIFSVAKDKRYGKMIKRLCEIPRITDFVVTHIPGGRGAELSEIETVFQKYAGKRVYAYENVEEALKFGMASKGADGVLYIVGSLYLAGMVR